MGLFKKPLTKYVAVYAIAVIVSGALITWLYVPVWNHNKGFLFAILALAFFHLVQTLWKRKPGTALVHLTGNLSLVYAVWNHNIPLLVVTIIYCLVVGAIAMVNAVRAEELEAKWALKHISKTS